MHGNKYKYRATTSAAMSCNNANMQVSAVLVSPARAAHLTGAVIQLRIAMKGAGTFII